jgi:hypothetical protein
MGGGSFELLTGEVISSNTVGGGNNNNKIDGNGETCE